MSLSPLTLHVSLEDRSYDILLGENILDDLGPRCAALLGKRRAVLVTDEHVAALYLQRAEESLVSAGLRVSSVVLPAGETTKSVQHLAALWEAAVEAKLDRKGVIIALGGGVIGDLAGFAAASYLRGVAFVQVPTTLLSMVDSAVGGKTGINLPQGKNLVGAFHQPNLVLADIQVLRSLPPREFSAGMAEVIKYGVIRDAELFARIENRVGAIRSLDAAELLHLVRRSCEIKADVVSQDEREGGLRAILNFGHTLGHAIENVCGYGEWLHGEAISIGMVYAARISEQRHGFPAADTDRLIALLRAFDLPVTWQGLDFAPLYEAMTVDKKAADAHPQFVLARSLGNVGLPEAVTHGELQQVFRS
jgi:3-dehydroquinate synthase